MELMTNKMTMTSREIAALVGSTHSNVKISIERLLKKGVIRSVALQDFDHTNNFGATVVHQEYLFSGEQGKRDSIVVVAQLSPEFTALIVDRWQELEKKVSVPQLNLNDPNQLRTLLLDNVEKVIALEHQVKEQNAKIESLENLFTDGMTAVAFCKQLNGVNTQKINSLLFSKKWLCNEGNWRVASYARDKYLTESVAHEYTDSKGVKQIKYKQDLLRKGAQRLHQMYIANELPMKKDWNGIYTHDKYVIKEVA